MKVNGIVMSAVIIAAVLAVFTAPAAADWTFDGFELKNMVSETVQGDVYVCYGDHGGTQRRTRPPQVYTTNYSVPDGTAVKWARLYVGVWGATEDRTGWVNTTLNASGTLHCLGNVSLDRTESTSTYSTGTNVYGSGHGVWTVSYNVTGNVTLGETNQAVATAGGGIDGREYGIVLVVVYENTGLPKVQYWVNEGNVNLHYNNSEGDYPGELNCNFTWFNGTAYNCTVANLTTLYYTGSDGENDYLFFDAPDKSDSPYNCSNVGWSNTSYTEWQLNGNDVADSHSGYNCTCDDNSVATTYFDLNCFSVTNGTDSPGLCDIVKHTYNNYAIFWRGHDDDGNDTIDGGFYNSDPEGEAYVHPIVAVLVLKDITHVYDFGDNYTGTPGEDAWAFKYQVDGSPGAGDPSTEFTPTQYGYIKTDNEVYQSDVTDTNGYYAAHRFNFSIDETNPEKINVTWNGKGKHDSLTDGAKLYIWNFTSTAYEHLQTSANTEDEVTLTGEKASSVSSYISPSGNVTILVNQTSPDVAGILNSHIETDYVKLVVTPDP